MTNPNRPQSFHTTSWSLISSARQVDDAEQKEQALTELYSNYWYPLFAYLRRKGYNTGDTADYLQGFFAELIEKDFLKVVEPKKGRFRWFLMSAVSRFVAKQLEKSNALKRGGGVKKLSFDVDDAEQRYALEPIEGWTPEKLFDRGWALQVLRQSLEMLHSEYKSKNKETLFVRLQASLTGDELAQKTYLEIGEELGMSEGAVKVAAHRIRKRFREVLEETVGQTVQSQDEIDDEISVLLNALQGK